MSTKHFFHSTEGVVVLGLESLVGRNNHLALDAPNKVVYSRTHSPSKVTVISGGGAGHEPCWAGMVRPCQIALMNPIKLMLLRLATVCSQQP
jgi:dihydroxyacetone kinase